MTNEQLAEEIAELLMGYPILNKDQMEALILFKLNERVGHAVHTES